MFCSSESDVGPHKVSQRAVAEEQQLYLSYHRLEQPTIAAYGSVSSQTKQNNDNRYSTLVNNMRKAQ